ncbi:unnamed protein product, partial [Phaeothamnion confervicola]
SFFRGTRAALEELAGAAAAPTTVAVTVRQAGKPDLMLAAPAGANLRDILVGANINVYRSVSRWTNCKGRQLCGTCIVAVDQGADGCTVQSVDERVTLGNSPPTHRLSCVTNVYDDVSVTVLPPLGPVAGGR